MQIEAKSAEQIIAEYKEAFVSDVVPHDSTDSDTIKIIRDAIEFTHIEWLKSALASHLLWSAVESRPISSQRSIRNRAIQEYHDNLTSLAHQIAK